MSTIMILMKGELIKKGEEWFVTYQIGKPVNLSSYPYVDIWSVNIDKIRVMPETKILNQKREVEFEIVFFNDEYYAKIITDEERN